MKCLELFAGAGGLAMGASLAGFEHVGVVEWDRWATDTIRENQRRGHPLVRDWPVFEGDVRKFDLSRLPADLDLVAGGPPCQPFSMGGKHRAHDDTRDMFPATVDIIRQTRPKAFIVENVKGLTRASFANYFSYIQLQLSFPEIGRRDGEVWSDHLARLERVKTGPSHSGLSYDVVARLVNAADYGVPQKRERVFLVGFRHDIQPEWAFPEETHSREALVHSQWVVGDYWDHHKVPKKLRPDCSPSEQATANRLRGRNAPLEQMPWRTVRDALVGLSDPERSPGAHLNHRFQPGARSYPGHTGSPIDQPAKTLKAGDHGVPGGENMLRRPDGSVRYFTARESARLQCFPDAYSLHGSWSEIMRQLGNAVPVTLAQVVASSVAESLINASAAGLARLPARGRA